MTCEECGGMNLYVKDSRPKELGYRRRRVCADCGHEIVTYEISEKNYKMLLKCDRVLARIQKWLNEFDPILPRKEMAIDEEDDEC